jgi:F0F1-type ATP synthase assembly protein I
LATMPVFLLIGIFLGGISGIYTIWKKNIYDKIK